MGHLDWQGFVGRDRATWTAVLPDDPAGIHGQMTFEDPGIAIWHVVERGGQAHGAE